MNKAELEARVAEETGVAKATVKEVLGKTFDVIVESMKKDEEVRLLGFGTFKTSIRKARTGKNPLDGSVINIPELRRVSFKAGQNLKKLD